MFDNAKRSLENHDLILFFFLFVTAFDDVPLYAAGAELPEADVAAEVVVFFTGFVFSLADNNLSALLLSLFMETERLEGCAGVELFCGARLAAALAEGTLVVEFEGETAFLCCGANN